MHPLVLLLVVLLARSCSYVSRTTLFQMSDGRPFRNALIALHNWVLNIPGGRFLAWKTTIISPIPPRPSTQHCFVRLVIVSSSTWREKRGTIQSRNCFLSPRSETQYSLTSIIILPFYRHFTCLLYSIIRHRNGSAYQMVNQTQVSSFSKASSNGVISLFVRKTNATRKCFQQTLNSFMIARFC